MGQRGPAPLPSEIKRARATLQPCRDNPREPVPSSVAGSARRNHLGDRQDEIPVLAATRAEVDVLKPTDRDVLVGAPARRSLSLSLAAERAPRAGSST